MNKSYLTRILTILFCITNGYAVKTSNKKVTEKNENASFSKKEQSQEYNNKPPRINYTAAEDAASKMLKPVYH